MTQVALPAHLANRQVRSLTERASEGMGSTLPPHISIQGNSFTFIDAAGNEYAPMLTFDAVVVDVSDAMCKRFYDKPFDPNASTFEPPACWSANGLAPSREATKPQAPTCADCPQNVRGSAISRMSGAAIKACRDEKWIAIMVPQMPQMIFQLVITPGSFGNWKGYTEGLRNFGCELSLTVTRFSFTPKKTGEIMFERIDWVAAETADQVEAAVREKKTDAIVGRNDQPRLAGPAPVAQINGPNQQIHQAAFEGVQQFVQQIPVQEVIPPGAAPFVQAAAPTVAAQPMQQVMPFPQGAAATGATPTSATTSPSEAPRRRRRTQAEIQAANGAAAAGAAPQPAQQQFVQQPVAQQPAPAAAPQAPFPVAGQAPSTFPGPAAAPQAQFGMAPGAPVNQDMAAMLSQMGFKQG